jgi:hypothetical protein
MIILFQFHIKALNFTSGIRKKQVRFQPKDDVMLLREVLAEIHLKLGQLGTKLQQSFPL